MVASEYKILKKPK